MTHTKTPWNFEKIGGMAAIGDKGTMAFHNARAALSKAKGESC